VSFALFTVDLKSSLLHAAKILAVRTADAAIYYVNCFLSQFVW